MPSTPHSTPAPSPELLYDRVRVAMITELDVTTCVCSWFTYLGLVSLLISMVGLAVFMKGGRKVRTVFIVRHDATLCETVSSRLLLTGNNDQLLDSLISPPHPLLFHVPSVWSCSYGRLRPSPHSWITAAKKRYQECLQWIPSNR